MPFQSVREWGSTLFCIPLTFVEWNNFTLDLDYFFSIIHYFSVLFEHHLDKSLSFGKNVKENRD